MGGEEAGYMIILRKKSYCRGPLLPPRKCRKQRRTTWCGRNQTLLQRVARGRGPQSRADGI